MPHETRGAVEHRHLELPEAAEYLLEECRMVLPGIQALFGFQLVVVFEAGFAEKLSAGEQHLHLLAIALVAIAVALIMAPAAYHRAAGAREITDVFVRVSTRLLLTSMVPLAMGLCIEFYLIARVLTAPATALGAALGLFAVFVGLWFLYPRLRSSSRPGRRASRAAVDADLMQRSWFSRFARSVSEAAAQPMAFAAVAGVTGGWLFTGWAFGWSDTWQLVMNTISSVVTFLMVFVIQNTQQRDTIALQIKLNELIRTDEGAPNTLLDLERLDEPRLREILARYERLAQRARERLSRGQTSPT